MKLSFHANFAMDILVIFIIYSFFIRHSLSETPSETQLTVLVGSTAEFSCPSSFPPPWTWHSSQGRYKMLTATGLKPHPQLKNSRYSFRVENSVYFLRIVDVSISDAGKFSCETEISVSTILNVIR